MVDDCCTMRMLFFGEAECLAQEAFLLISFDLKRRLLSQSQTSCLDPAVRLFKTAPKQRTIRH